MRPGQTPAQMSGMLSTILQVVEARAELASGVGRVLALKLSPDRRRSIVLAEARRVDSIGLARRHRRNADNGGAHRQCIAIAAFKARGVALSVEARGELIASAMRLVVNP